MERMGDVLRADQFDKVFLEHLYRVTNKVRTIAKTTVGSAYLKKLLSNKRAMLYFSQPSTRTYMSFLNACQILGLTNSSIRETSTSSEVKGESKLDSLRTFSSYVDLIIMRTSDVTFAEDSAAFLKKTRRPIPIINAGSGVMEHPTQALLDIYTLQRSFKNNGGLDGKQILFCGDLARGRTVKSLVQLLDYYKVEIVQCAPPKLQLGNSFRHSEKIEEFLGTADAVYMTRIQDEYDVGEDKTQKSYDGFKLTKDNIKMMKANSIIMHPLPRRDEIATEIDDDPRAMYWRQCRNGMWTRVALIAYLFDKDGDILKY